MKSTSIIKAGVGISVFALVILGGSMGASAQTVNGPLPAYVSTVAAPTAFACKVKTIPPKLPWYQCVMIFPGQLLPAGCYPTYSCV